MRRRRSRPNWSKKTAKKSPFSEEAAATIVSGVGGQRWVVDKVLKKTIKRNPLPPFITSKLQQDAIRKLQFSAKKTMLIAQQLYEGIELGPGEPVGLITYMRTDSTRIAAEAAEEALPLIREQFGRSMRSPNRGFSKTARKCRMPTRPSGPLRFTIPPKKSSPSSSKDQLALYRMIWQRFIASQMQPALIDQITASIQAGPYLFNASGSSIRFPGFMALYHVRRRREGQRSGQERCLPELALGMVLELIRLEPKQHFTQPPPRFSEASLVKELEENGIGRPSTYAAILSTIREKGYVDWSRGIFTPANWASSLTICWWPIFPTSSMWNLRPGWRTTWTGSRRPKSIRYEVL